MNSPAGRSRQVFLTAEWRDLAIVSYRVDPTLLHPYLPAGTELDLWHGEALVSVIGFRFLDTRVLGIGIPFHRNFDEVNLRFYVRSNHSGQVRHGALDHVFCQVTKGATRWVRQASSAHVLHERGQGASVQPTAL